MLSGSEASGVGHAAARLAIPDASLRSAWHVRGRFLWHDMWAVYPRGSI